MSDSTSSKPLAGHWLLAKVGKKVLRPGGLETTRWLIEQLPIRDQRVVEFAPGLGVTAQEILQKKPSTYTGVDADPHAVDTTKQTLAEIVEKSPTSPANVEIINGSAAETGLPDNSADIVVGEAMLTMQTDKHKLEIMQEAARILAPGGYYAIHELGLTPDELDSEVKTEIQRALARAIKVNARPLTTAEWTEIAEQAGFTVVGVYHAPMALLEPRRMIADEGPLRTAKIVFNILRQPDIRRRILTMRSTFREHANHMNAIGMVLKRN